MAFTTKTKITPAFTQAQRDKILNEIVQRLITVEVEGGGGGGGDVLETPLTGYSVGSGKVALTAEDELLAALQKLQGWLNALGNSADLAVATSSTDVTPNRVWTTSTLVKTTGPSDMTGGSVMVVGDFSIGAVTTTQRADTAAIESTRGTEVWRRLSATSNPYGVTGVGFHMSYNFNSAAQLYMSVNEAVQQVWARTTTGSNIWGAPVLLYHTGNTSANVQTMLGAANNAAIRTAISASLLPAYTLGTVPSAASNTNMLIVITDLSGGREPCFSDGTDWRVCSTRAVAA